MKLGVLVSGILGLNCLKNILVKYDVKIVLTDRSSFGIIAFCKTNEIPVFAGNPRNRNAAAIIGQVEIDVLLSVNYLFVVDNDILTWPKKYAINIHGSLLPKYRGRTPHVWAIINNEKETGITAHLMVDKCDGGDILKQIVIPIHSDMTGADVLSRYGEIYPVLIDEVMSDVLNNNISLKQQNETIATYFGKRTPDDGLIDFNWQKERIYNWVRALAKPYPGAFFIYHGHVVKSHRLHMSNIGYDYTDENRLILQVGDGSLIIKTPNGAIELSELEYEKGINFTTKTVLNKSDEGN